MPQLARARPPYAGQSLENMKVERDQPDVPLSEKVVPSYAPAHPNRLDTVIRRAKIAVFVGMGIALAVGLWGHARWSHNVQTFVYALEAATLPVPQRPGRFYEEQLATLPPVVQRYFAKVLTPNQPLVHRVYLEQTGTFNRSFQQPQWDTFTARQRIATARPGFVWDAAISMGPGIDVRVVDAYVAGTGTLQPSVLGLVDLAGQQGGADIARGELMRYLAEAVWYPTALLPGQGVQWTAVDAQSALATLTDGALTVALTFHFDAQGWVQRITSDARSAMVDGTLVPMPWEAVVSDYQLRDGMWVPLQAEVAWTPASGRVPYWRGKIEKIDYELPR